MIVLNILNSLVPTAAITLIAWVSLRLLRANAATRYGVWWVVLASVIAMVLRPQQSAPISSAPPVSVEPAKLDWLLWAIAVWAAYALYRTVRMVVGYVWLRRIQRNAMPWSQSGVVLSDDIEGPITAGFLRPVIVLPTSFPEKLTAEEIEHVLLHEQAHIARRDQWANLLARVVGVFFGLHPVAAFALNRIERERERACDDWVVAATGDARPYAASLTRVFELTRRVSQPDLASGFMGSRLGGRIEELLTKGRVFTRRASIAMLAAIVVPIVILGVRAPATVAYAQAEKPAQQAKPVQQAAPTKNVAADRLEALIAQLEVALRRMNPALLHDQHAAAQATRMRDQLRARQAEMKAMEAEMANQQRQLELQLLEVERVMQGLNAKQANPQYR